MCGSSIPLHLAQVPTYAIVIWQDMTLMPGSWKVWAEAWPLILIAVAAGLIIARRLSRSAIRFEDVPYSTTAPSRGLAPGLATAIFWSCSVLLPLGLFLDNLLNGPCATATGAHVLINALRTFWRLAHEAVFNSAFVAGFVAIVALVLAAAMCVISSRSGQPRRAAPPRSSRRSSSPGSSPESSSAPRSPPP